MFNQLKTQVDVLSQAGLGVLLGELKRGRDVYSGKWTNTIEITMGLQRFWDIGMSDFLIHMVLSCLR